LKIVLLGAPGAGKGTQAKLICDYYKIPLISTGDIFRAQIREKSTLGIKANQYIQKGELVPDDLTIAIVKEVLNEKKTSKDFLLDGFPRNLHQVEKLEEILAEKKDYIDKAFLINVSKKNILERVSGRRFCYQCGANYHIQFNPSKSENKCELCGNALIQRTDDKENIVLDRLSIYSKTIEPIVKYYIEREKLEIIKGNAEVDEVFSNICNSLKELRRN